MAVDKAKPTKELTASSLRRMRPTSLRLSSLRAMPRITKVELWEPVLPPVSVSMGMKVTRTGRETKAASYLPKMLPVTVADSIRIINQITRFLAKENTLVFR